MTWCQHEFKWEHFRVTDTGGFPSQRPVKGSFDVFFDLRLSKRLSKQSRRRWFETPSRSMWRHCNESFTYSSGIIMESSLLINLSLQFKLFIHFAFYLTVCNDDMYTVLCWCWFLNDRFIWHFIQWTALNQKKRPGGLTSSAATVTLGPEIGPLWHTIEIHLKVTQMIT